MNLIATRDRWPALARDLAILSAPDSPITFEMVCENYSLTPESAVELAKVPAFRQMYRRELEAVEKGGDRAGMRYRAMSQAQLLSEKLFRDAVGGADMEAKDALKLLEILLRSAGLLDGDKAVAQVAVQTSVSLPLPRIPRVAHALPAERVGG